MESTDLNQITLSLNKLTVLQQSLIPTRKPSTAALELLHKLDWLQISISSFSACCFFLFFSGYIWNILDTYLTIASIISGSSTTYILQFSLFVDGATALPLAIIISLILLWSWISIFWHSGDSKFILLEWLGKKIFPYLRYAIQISLSVSALCILNGTGASGFCYVVFAAVSLTSLFIACFLQNFSLRKDIFCCRSLSFFLLLRATIITTFCINSFAYNKVETTAGLVTFISVHILISTLVYFAYFLIGIEIYRMKIMRWLLVFMICAHASLSIGMLFDYIGKGDLEIFLFFPIIFLFLMFFTYNTLERMRRNANCLSSYLRKIYFIFNKLEGVDQDQEDDCEVRGMLKFHIQSYCSNPNCFVNSKDKAHLYDSKKKKYCSTDKINQGKISLIKFYVQCILQKQLFQSSKSSSISEYTDILLHYAQFIYLKLKNTFKMMKLISQLQSKYLDVWQKIKLQRIKRVMRQECNKISEELYLSKLNIENVLQAESTFDLIQKQISVILARNQIFWKYIQRNEVNLSEMLGVIKPNLSLIERVNDHWQLIFRYFQFNRRWKFTYLCYTIYIKNEKLKPNVLQEFGHSVQYDEIFKSDSYFLDKTTEGEGLYNAKMMFQTNTCYIHTKSTQQKTIITRISNYFSMNFGYQKEQVCVLIIVQVIGSPLKMLMPSSVAAFHHQSFLSWASTGCSNHQQSYKVLKIFPLSKSGYLIPMFKFYKQYVDHNFDLEYIAMLKRNKQQENLMLLNSQFQIEGITTSLSQKMRITDQEYALLKKINLIAIMPVLAKYTKFSELITEKDEGFIQQDNNKAYYLKQLSINSAAKSMNMNFSSILTSKKRITLSNLRIMLPKDLKQAVSIYQNALPKGVWPAIQQLNVFIRKHRNFRKFKAEIEIRLREISKTKYYQIELNQIQENNLLQSQNQHQSLQHEMEMNMSNASLNLAHTHSSHGTQDKSCYSPFISPQQPEYITVPPKLTMLDLHLFLQPPQKSSKITLFPSNNIFLKQEHNKALTQIAHISNIALTMRAILLLFIIGVVISASRQSILLQGIQQRSNMLQMVISYNIYNLQLQTTYQASMLSLRNDSLLSSQIVNVTQEIMSIMADLDFQAIIYDPFFNQPANFTAYVPMSMNTSANASAYNLSTTAPILNQEALIIKLYECIVTIHRYSELSENATIDIRQYHQFIQYLIPSFRVLLNSIAGRIADSINDDMGRLSNLAYIQFAVEACLLAIAFLIAISRLLRVTRGFIQLLSIFIQMDNADIKKISKFASYISSIFRHLAKREEKMAEIITNSRQNKKKSSCLFDKYASTESPEQKENILNANLNKKIKKITHGPSISRIKYRAILFIFIYLAITALSCFSLNFYSLYALQSFNHYHSLSLQLIERAPAYPAAAIGVFQKARNASEYQDGKYTDQIHTLTAIKSSTSTLQIAAGSTDVQQAFYQIYFGNICDWIGKNNINTIYDAQLCLNDNQLKQGLQNYLNYITPQFSNYLSSLITVSQTFLSQVMISTFTIVSVNISLVALWCSSFISAISTYSSILLGSTAGVILLLVCGHIILLEVIIIGNLKEDYQVFRGMHEGMIPDFVIVKEKIIKAKLIKEGFMYE